MKLLSLLAAASILAFAPAAAQVKPGAPPQAQSEPDDEEALAMLRGAVDEMRRNMFAPGPAVPGWNEGGADPDSELRARGADRHVLLLTGAQPSVVMLTPRPIADFAPAGWRLVDSYGRADERLETPFVQFIRLTARYVLAARANSRRVGAADCVDSISHARLYEVPDAPESADDETLPLYFRIALLAGEGQVVCTRYDREGEGWRMRSFLPDGRSLPQLDDENERLSIVPLAPLETLIAPPAGTGTRS